MSQQQRDKLLPYEHQLIEALGITKEQYLDFVAQQYVYSDTKAGGGLDIRNDFGIVAIVLTVVGIIFQVVAALIAPPPQQAQAPRVSAQGGGGVPSSRDEIFAPRFGFNTQQQLAAYGDPINLVYTNTDTNPSGGVRVATSLIWSAILSYGNSQLVRLMFVLCAGGIGRIDEEKSAFGQTALRDLVAQNYWLYFAPNYTGFLQNSHVRPALNGLTVSDPTTLGSSSSNPYLIRSTINSTSEGFSHCYSPSTANVFGIYGAVPINVLIGIRNAAGYFEYAINGVEMSVAGQSGYVERQTISLGTEVLIGLLRAAGGDEGLAVEEAKDSRRTLVSVFDNSGVFKFGSTKLKAISVSRGDIVDGSMLVTLRAIETGRAHSVAYGTDLASNVNFADSIADTPLGQRRRQWEAARTIVNQVLNEDERPEINSAETMVNDGRIFQLQIVGWDNYTERGGDNWYQNENGDWSYQEYYEREVSVPIYAYVLTRNLTDNELNACRSYISLNPIAGDDALANRSSELFYTKALIRIEEASYETISPCNIVDFSLKARIFKRVNGRQEEYGSSRVGSGYKSADNGLKYRSLLFLVKVKRAQDLSYTTAPYIFVVRRSADIENYIYFRFRSGTSGASNAEQWQFKFEPIYDIASEIASKPELSTANGETIYCYLENTGDQQSVGIGSTFFPGAYFDFVGSVKTSTFLPALNQQPAGMNEWDVFSNTSDSQIQFSFDNGPEMSLAAVTEQIIDPYSNYSGLYDNIALIGLNMYSGKSVQDLRSFSVFAEQGRLSRLLRTSGTVGGIGWGQPGFQYLSDTANGYANTAPDIFVDTVLDVQDGIGRHASIHSIDLEQLAKSKKFCETNLLFMDGIIAEPSSWRQFWAQFAAFSLLELAKVGGQDVLIPAVPYVPTTGTITRTIPITALFNQGNIIEESYKEEFIDYGENTQDMIVTVIYRKTDNTGAFNVNTSVDVQLADTVEESAARKTIDASAFVTRRDQAIKLGKFLCNSKRYSQRACEFKTFPTDSPVFPGAYVYVELAHNQWDGIYTGIIEDGGFLNMPITASIPNGSSYSMLIYSPDDGASSTQSFTGVTIGNNRASIAGNTSAFQNYVGKLFVVGTVVNNKRIFRVTEVQMDEEGEVTVRGVHHATDANGLSLISRGITENISGLFLIDGRPE
jgi:hypothetical protein